MDLDDPDNGGAKAAAERPQQVSFKKKESERATAARKSTYAYKKSIEDAEPWVPLEVSTVPIGLCPVGYRVPTSPPPAIPLGITNICAPGMVHGVSHGVSGLDCLAGCLASIRLTSFLHDICSYTRTRTHAQVYGQNDDRSLDEFSRMFVEHEDGGAGGGTRRGTTTKEFPPCERYLQGLDYMEEYDENGESFSAGGRGR